MSGWERESGESEREEKKERGVRPLEREKERGGRSGCWKEQLQSLSAQPLPLSLSTGCGTDPLPPVCGRRHKAAVMDQ